MGFLSGERGVATVVSIGSFIFSVIEVLVLARSSYNKFWFLTVN